MIKLNTILVPSDFSECSDAAVRYGTSTEEGEAA